MSGPTADEDASGDVARAIGCAACRHRGDAEQAWVRAFGHEGNADPRVLSAVAAARGFCAAHTRAVLGRSDASVLLPPVLAAIARARAGEARAGGSPTPCACPACRSEDQAETDLIARLGGEMSDAEVPPTVAASGLCRPHAVALCATAPAGATAAIVTALVARLGQDDAAADALGGTSPDVARRTPYLLRIAAELPQRDEHAASVPVLRRLGDALTAGSCPCCRAAGDGAVRYLLWLASSARAAAKLDTRETTLCGRHFQDLGAVAPQDAGAVVRREATAVAARLAPMSGLRSGSRRARRAEIARFEESGRRCPACLAAATTAESVAAVAVAGMPDPVLRDGLASGHGFCVEHAFAVAARSGSALPVETLRARLQVTAFELDEAVRKRSWWFRHEPRGPEMATWRAAPTLLDGATYLGRGPAETAAAR